MERLTNSDYHFCANCHNYNDCAHTEDNGFPVCPERARHDRLADIEDILGDEYDLELLQKLVEAEREDRFIVMKEPRQAGAHRIAELARADREGRCVVLPCKKGDVVWRIAHDATTHIVKDRCTGIEIEDGRVWVHLIGIGDEVMGSWDFGKLLFRAHEEAEAALRRSRMAGYIERAALYEVMNGQDCEFSLIDALALIEEFPATDVAEVRHGHWETWAGGLAKCSVCGYEYCDRLECDTFCGNCGARMDKEDNQ